MSSTIKRSKRRKTGSSKASKPCPFKDQEVEQTHNSPDWYTKEYIPLIGANYNILSNVGIEQRLMKNGMQLNVGVTHETILSIPVDDDFSAYKQIALLWEDLREMNSGAVNYTVQELAAYAFNQITLRGLCYYLQRCFAALRYKSPLMKDSPQIYINMCGIASYTGEIAAYAANWNRAAFLLHDIEQLPIVPYSLLDRLKFIYGTLFADSPTTRPAMISFLPTVLFTYAVNSAGTDVVATPIRMPGSGTATIANLLNVIETIFNTMISSNVYATIRGDMLKAFGAGALRADLVSGLSEPLKFGYNEDVACQLENATLAGFDGSTIALNMSVASMTATITCTRVNAFSDDAYDQNQHIINFHGASAPRDGALLALTRLHSVGSINGSGGITVANASGIVICNTGFITDTNMSTGPTVEWITTLLGNMHSSVQSTSEAAHKKLAGLISLVDRFPMVYTDETDPFGFIFDVDNFTILDSNTLQDFGQVANRSLLAVRVPRGDNMSTRKYMIQ